jgi:hypothetical protein
MGWALGGGGAHPCPYILCLCKYQLNSKHLLQQRVSIKAFNFVVFESRNEKPNHFSSLQSLGVGKKNVCLSPEKKFMESERNFSKNRPNTLSFEKTTLKVTRSCKTPKSARVFVAIIVVY